MKAFLMFRDRDFDLRNPLPPNADSLVQDLELETLFNAMARGDDFIREVEKAALLMAVHGTVADIEYRQWIMIDSLRNPGVVRGLYDLATEALAREREASYFSFYRDSPSLLLHRSIDVIRVFIDVLRRLRKIAELSSDEFRSEGFQTLFAMLRNELSDGFFEEVSQHLRKLAFSDGILVSAHLGDANKGVDYVLRDPPQDRRIWPLRLFPRKLGGYTLHVHPRDEAGAQALSDLRNRGLALTSQALGQAVDHILNFFKMLRTELAFYIGGINLYEKMTTLGLKTAFPHVWPMEEYRLNCKGLFDICLAITLNKDVVGNDVNADHRQLVMITGANQGGKSTFLRSVGLAQIMMQSGLFVAAEMFDANVVRGIFTHYKREEDRSMTSGKFDEELKRMSALADALTPNAMILFNESFASTNEREGSEIGMQIVSALLDSGLKILFVTHLYQFAHAMDEMQSQRTLFLRAERHDDGERTYKLSEGKPLETSFGEDLYLKVFGDDACN